MLMMGGASAHEGGRKMPLRLMRQVCLFPPLDPELSPISNASDQANIESAIALFRAHVTKNTEALDHLTSDVPFFMRFSDLLRNDIWVITTHPTRHPPFTYLGYAWDFDVTYPVLFFFEFTLHVYYLIVHQDHLQTDPYYLAGMFVHECAHFCGAPGGRTTAHTLADRAARLAGIPFRYVFLDEEWYTGTPRPKP
jgi:hypothetical protein